MKKAILNLFLLLITILSFTKLSSQDCEIIIPFVETYECDAANGTYSIDFGIEVDNPTSDSVDVWVNNTLIGLYETQDFLTIDDIPLQSNTNSALLLVCVHDNTQCCYVYTYEEPDCDEECDFEYLEVVAECNDDGNYTLIIEYGINNPQSDFLGLWINGDFYDEYEVQANGFWFIEVEGVAPSGSDLGSILLCSGDGESCCEDASYEQPNCEGEACSVDYIEVGTSECENGTYTLTIFYGISNPDNDFLDLWVNNDFVGNYEIDADGEGMIVVENVTPRPNTDWDIVEICVNDNPDCCLAFEYLHPGCESEECNFEYLEVEAVCDENGNYNLIIEYGINNPQGDFISLWINGDFYDEYEVQANGFWFIEVEGVAPSGSDLGSILLCSGDGDNCCEDASYEQPNCEGEACSVDYIEVETSECENGTYTLTIFYGISNPDNDFLDLWVNNDFVGNYEIDAGGEGMIVVDGVEPRENTPWDIVEICVNDNPDCCLAFEYLHPECDGGEECDFEYIEFSVECNDDGNYNFIIEYGINNPQGDVVNLWFNGIFYGDFETQPDGTGVIEANNVEPVEGNVGSFLLCSGEGEGCCEVIEYEQPECDGEGCSINWIEIDVLACNNGTYGLDIYYDVTNPGNDFIELWAGGDYIGFYEINGEPISLDGLNWGSAGDGIGIQLCVNDVPDCCLESEFEVPNCDGEECDITFLEVTAECQEDGNYTLFIEYGVINPIDEFVLVSVNGVNYGDFDHDMTGSFEIEDIEPVEGEDFGFIVLCSDETGDLCCAEAEYEQPECDGEECSINWIEIEVLECDGDTYGLEIYYDVTNPGNDFIELWAGGDYIDFYEINGEPITLDGLNWGEAGEVIGIQLCVNDVPDCCLEAEFEVPDCTNGAQEDLPPYELIVDSSTDEIILTPLNNLPYNMMMFSMDAKLLQKSEEEEGITRMPVNEPGIYIVRVETERKVFYSKILYIQ